MASTCQQVRLTLWCTAASMPIKTILIENCTVRSHASGYKLGSESLANFTNITVHNSQVLAGTHRAISIQLRDQGYVRYRPRRLQPWPALLLLPSGGP